MARIAPRKSAADFFSVGSDEESDRVSDEELSEQVKGSGKGNDLESDNDDDDEGYDSEEEEKGRSSIVKSQSENVSDDDDEADEDGEDEEEADDAEDENEESEDGEGVGGKRKRNDKGTGSKKLKTISQEDLEDKLNKIKKTGVVYISRIPPFMKPEKLRHILSRFGEVDRIFLAPEDAKARARRVKYGGNKKKKYTEGWAEFKKKRCAKLAADTLNGNKIGGKKGNFYYDDILNVKYLHKFKWHDLTDQIALENQSRQEKMRAEIAQATRESKTFIENVEKSKMIQGIQQKRQEKGKNTGDEVRRTFDQRKTSTRVAGKSKQTKDEKLANVLSKVF